jgi:ABC-type transport system involved in multi-copper enzyme maturation permease subunit
VTVKTVRFIIAVLICCLLMPLSVWVLSNDYLRDAEDYTGRVSLDARRIDGKAFSINVNRPIPPLSTLYRGAYPESVNSINLKFYVGWNLPAAATTQSLANDLFPTVDLTFIVGIVLSAMALMFSFDALSGEKAEATLRLIMANPVPRSRVVLGKWLGLSAALLVPFIIGFILSLLIFFGITGVQLSGDEWGALALTALAAVLYLSLFMLVGVVISAFTGNPTVSIFVCLAVWGVLTIILPQTANAVAEAITPAPAPQTVEKHIRTAYNDFAEKLRAYNLEAYARAKREGLDGDAAEALKDQNEFMSAVENRRQVNAIEREYWLKVQRQEEVGHTAALLSPYGCYSQAVISLANTGPTAQRHFLTSAYSYGEEYYADIWTRVFNTQGLRSRDAAETAPKFHFSDLALATRIEQSLAPLGVMLGLMAVLLFVAVVAFNRYDVR